MKNKLKPCPFCHEDEEGYVKALGAFCIYSPFHNGEYYLNCGKAKPRRINFCPMCGRNLNPKKEIKDDE